MIWFSGSPESSVLFLFLALVDHDSKPQVAPSACRMKGRNLFALLRRGLIADLQCCHVLKKSRTPDFTSTSGSPSFTSHKEYSLGWKSLRCHLIARRIISPTIFCVICSSSSSVFPLKHSTIAAELDFSQPETAAIFCKQWEQIVLDTFPLSGSMRHRVQQEQPKLLHKGCWSLACPSSWGRALEALTILHTTGWAGGEKLCLQFFLIQKYSETMLVNNGLGWEGWVT